MKRKEFREMNVEEIMDDFRVNVKELEIFDLFSFWKMQTGHLKAELNQKRRKSIVQALGRGHTVKQLKEAIIGVTISPFHNGENSRGKRYDDLSLILRNASKVEYLQKIYLAAHESTSKRFEEAKIFFIKKGYSEK